MWYIVDIQFSKNLLGRVSKEIDRKANYSQQCVRQHRCKWVVIYIIHKLYQNLTRSLRHLK
jgi:hypothetical protein